MRANHSKDCGKGLVRLETMLISKLNLCKAEIKNKGFARLETTFIFKLTLCKADIKNKGLARRKTEANL